MGRRGINPKDWFFAFQRNFSENPERALVFAGAACEQWVNAELFQVISKELVNTDLTLYSEYSHAPKDANRRHDLAVLEHNPADPGAWQRPCAVVEVKLVYSNHGDRTARIDELFQQTISCDPEIKDRIGLLLGVYAYWPDYRSTGESFSDFQGDIGSRFRERVAKGADGYTVKVDHGGSMARFTDERSFRVGAAEAKVGLFAQYFRVQPNQ